MKVLQINVVCGYGSTGRIVVDLAKTIEKEGDECVVTYGRYEAPKDIKTIKIGSKKDIFAHVLKTRILDKHGFGSVNATKKLIKQIEEYNPDIVHLHNIHGYYVNIEILFKYLKKINKPIVWTLHDCWAFTGHCAYFDYVKCDKWISGCEKCPQKNQYPNSNLKDNSIWNYKRKKELFIGLDNLTIVTPSRWLAQLVSKSFLKEYPIKVINNGIDLNIFKPVKSNFRQKYSIENKKILLGVANIWEERKGIKYFFDLANELDEDYIVVIVGKIIDKRKNIPSNIIHIERTNDINELVKIYSEADIFFNPTLEDNFPTVNIEALSCGTPVITFDSGGSKEIIDESCGMVFNKDDMFSLINKINKKKFNFDYCRKRAKLFNKEDKYKEYYVLYNNLIGR